MRLALLIIQSIVCFGTGALLAAQATPNIVVILADDLGYGDLSCYGATKVRTPNIDRLAKEGMLFTDAHSPHSVCSPTRYGLLTGRYCWRSWCGTGCIWSDDPLLIDANRLTLPRLLKQSGYHTACIGKWHLGFGAPGTPGWDDRLGPDYNRDLTPGPAEVGFDYFFGIPHVGQLPHVLIENRRIVGLDANDPIRIVLDPRTQERASYKDRTSVVPAHKFQGGKAATYQHEDLAITLTQRAVQCIEQQKHEPFFFYFAHRNVHAPLKPNARFQKTSDIGVYGDFLNELDWSVGEVLNALDRRGFTRNTLVLFSSDNGAVHREYKTTNSVDYNGHKANGPLRGQKTEAYEGGHRVPLLARWPGHIQPGSRSPQLVALTDLMATVAELLNRPLPHDSAEDSFGFLHALLGREPRTAVRDSIVHDSYLGLFAIRQGPWKLILGQGGGGLGWTPDKQDPSQPPGQLFNLASDLSERDNLYTQHPEIVSRLTALLKQYQHEGRSR